VLAAPGIVAGALLTDNIFALKMSGFFYKKKQIQLGGGGGCA
jgi:hypothetical protein